MGYRRHGPGLGSWFSSISSCSSISTCSLASSSVPHKGTISFSPTSFILFKPPVPPATPVLFDLPVCPLSGMLGLLSALCYSCILCLGLFLGGAPGFLPKGLALVLFSCCRPGLATGGVWISSGVCLELGFTVGPPCGLSAYILNYLSGAPVWGPAAGGVMDFTMLCPGWLKTSQGSYILLYYSTVKEKVQIKKG